MDTGHYLPLLTVELEHGFFASGRCPALRMVPAGDGVRRFTDAGGLVRDTGQGVVVFASADTRDAVELLAADAQEPLALAWQLQADDSFFFNYTEGLARQGDGLLWLDSASAVHEADRDGRDTWRLHQGATAGAPEWRSPGDPLAAGLLGTGPRHRPPLGLVRVVLDAATLHALWPRDDAGSSVPPRRYRVRLQARATVWKYCLFGDWGAEALQVVDLAREAEFEPAQPETLAVGRTALAIRSRGRLALQERSERRFQLRGQSAGADKVLVKRLPVAAPGSLCREIIAGEPTLVSEIFVHR